MGGKKGASKKGSTAGKVANKKTNKLKRKKNKEQTRQRINAKLKQGKGPQGGKKGAPGGKKGAQKRKRGEEEEEEEVEETKIDETKYFEKNPHFLGFLNQLNPHHLAPKELSKKEKRRKKKKAKQDGDEPPSQEAPKAKENEGEDGAEGGRRKKAPVTEEDDGEAYERAPRKLKREKQRLPVLEQGKMVENLAPLSKSEQKEEEATRALEGEDGGEEEDEEPDDEDDNVELDLDKLDAEVEEEERIKKKKRRQEEELEKIPEVPTDPRLLDIHRRRRIAKMKERIAIIAESVLSNPEKHIKEMSTLHEMCLDVDIAVQQLAMLSEAEIYKDIMPGYRIRLPTEKELKGKVTKEQKALRNFERQLLQGYTRFVKFLTTKRRELLTPKGKATHMPAQASSFQIALVRSICTLLERGYSFNLAKDLVNSVVPLLTNRYPEVRAVVLGSLKVLFEKDVAGDATLEAVRIIAKTVKSRNGHVKDEVLESLLHLPLSRDVIASGAREKERIEKLKQKKRKKKEKVKFDDPTLEKDLQKAEPEVRLAHRERTQTEILTLLFTTYFRILKENKKIPGLALVLKGLSKFAHLINLELVLDLLQLLKDLINQKKQQEDDTRIAESFTRKGLPLESALYCILTSFIVLSGQGAAISIDVKEFFLHLYSLCWEMADPANYHHTPLFLQCVHFMFIVQKQLSTDRVASFVRRMGIVSLLLPFHAAISFVHSIQNLLHKYPKCKQLFDKECTLTGTYLPFVADPDLCNPFSSISWELCLQLTSPHSVLQSFVSKILKEEDPPLDLIRMTSGEIFSKFDSKDTDPLSGAPSPPSTQILNFKLTKNHKGKKSKNTRKLFLKRKLSLQRATFPATYSPFLQSLLVQQEQHQQQEQLQ